MTEGRAGRGGGGVGGEEIGWEESECHPSAAFQITLNSGKPDASRTLSPELCCLWLPSTGCLSSLIGLTFPLSVLAVPHFPASHGAGPLKSRASKSSANASGSRVQTKPLEDVEKKMVGRCVCGGGVMLNTGGAAMSD